jgi:hypothetical protein
MGFFDPLGDRLVLCEMFADDAFATGWGDLAVPNAVGINDHPRAAAAHAQAGGFGAHRGDAEVFEPRLEHVPCGEAVGGGAAIGPDAEQHVATGVLDVHFGEAGGDDGVGHGDWWRVEG